MWSAPRSAWRILAGWLWAPLQRSRGIAAGRSGGRAAMASVVVVTVKECPNPVEADSADAVGVSRGSASRSGSGQAVQLLLRLVRARVVVMKMPMLLFLVLKKEKEKKRGSPAVSSDYWLPCRAAPPWVAEWTEWAARAVC